MKAERKVSSEEAKKFAKENGLLASMESSAKDNLRIEEAFLALTRVSSLVRRVGSCSRSLFQRFPPVENLSIVPLSKWRLKL